MVNKEQIETIINNIMSATPIETDKCGGGNSSSSGGGKKKPKKSNTNTPKLEDFDEKDFSREEYSDEEYAHSTKIDYEWESPQGRIQKIQSDMQRGRDYSSVEMKCSHEWSTSLFIDLNSYLFKGSPSGDEYAFTQYIGGERDINLSEASKILSNAIDKSPRLQESCVTYRWGPLGDLANMEIGDTGKFDGFQSTTWNYTVATKALKKQVGGWFKKNRGMIRFFNMKGTKGMVIDDTVTCNDWQSEWLLDKNQNYMLVGKGKVDYDGKKIMTYDVLVY